MQMLLFFMAVSATKLILPIDIKFLGVLRFELILQYLFLNFLYIGLVKYIKILLSIVVNQSCILTQIDVYNDFCGILTKQMLMKKPLAQRDVMRL